MDEDIREKIKDADMILVGIGEEFDGTALLKENENYATGKNLLEEAGYHWLVPMWREYCADRLEDKSIDNALEKLRELLQEKNYFVVSVATNRKIAETDWKDGRLVMPCGSTLKKQCVRGCGAEPEPLISADRKLMGEVFDTLYQGNFPEQGIPSLGQCRQCGGIVVLNNVYAENYSENGYLEQWKLYTKWLQGTLNHKLLLLELGVSLRFPSVIRWPFEKVAFYNNKAFFCRVNENLYQLTEELAAKGVGISQNTIDWINHL